jgi:cupin superfamily acireductone dioxygenase involved in methionine salvage
METGNRWTFECPNHYETPDDFQAIDLLAGERGYKNRDIIDVSKESMGDQYEARLKIFFDEFVTSARMGQTCG